MKKRAKLRLLASPADRETLAPILEELKKSGASVTETGKGSGKDELLLAALSESFYADETLTGALLSCLSEGAEHVLPLKLDAAEIPSQLKNALYARNVLPAEERSPELLAERILSAAPEKKNRLPLLLTAGAVVLAVIAGLLIWRAAQPKEEPVPAMAETAPLPLNLPAGLTAEDLAKIQAVVIVGDRAEFYTGQDLRDRGNHVEFEEFASRSFERDGVHYYSKDDGHEHLMTRYEDLTYLALMPNLQILDMSLVEAPSEGLPDLTRVKRLSEVMLADSNIPDLRWLSGSSVRSVHVLNTTGSVRDFSPLTDCRSLTEVHIDVNRVSQADLSGFCPPRLQWLWINGDGDLRGELDLSDLRNCTGLREVDFQNLPLTDLSFLTEAGGLTRVFLSGLHRLRDISALGGKASLRDVEIQDCDGIADFSPLADCGVLQNFRYRTESRGVFRDASFLSDLPYIAAVELENVDLPDLEFLRPIGVRRASLNLNLTGNVGDYAGLESVQGFGKLTLDPGDDTPLERILPYLADTPIRDLELHRFDEVDLSALPAVTERLQLDRCGIEDLSSLPEGWDAFRLCLRNCPRLRSLEGLEKAGFGRHGVGTLEIELCPRLTDWSALEGMDLSSLEILGGVTLPDFALFHAGKVRLDSVGDVADLGFLDGADADRAWNFALLGLDVNNLAPLSRFHGSTLTVTPQLAEQAEDLVRAGNFHEVRVEYPEGAWEMENEGFTLLSLEELETLPPALLRRVTEVHIAGDRLVDPERFELREDWSRRDRNGNPGVVLYDRETEESEPLGPGVAEDMGFLSQLTGLKRLSLWGQPLKTLDGIQAFSSLEQFSAMGCFALTDASPLFALQQLQDVDLRDTAVESIQGIQNLPQLRRLAVSHSGVTDLTPLGACDLSFACAQGGFSLDANDIRFSEEDLAAMGTVARYSDLAFTNADPSLWIPALADCEIGHFGAAGDLPSDGDLAAFAAGHPELRGLWLGGNDRLTDLTCLLSLEDLESVGVDDSMKKAIDSLEGQNYRFRLEIN